MNRQTNNTMTVEAGQRCSEAYGDAIYVPVEGSDFAGEALEALRSGMRHAEPNGSLLLIDCRRAVWNENSMIQARIFIWGLSDYEDRIGSDRAVVICPDFVSHQYVRFMAMLDDVWNGASMQAFETCEAAAAWLEKRSGSSGSLRRHRAAG